ncbi:ABC transporter permease [Phytohabitans sp. ZYX-F-186]|uniref:ABC transporter permease n=1 Tax=Phytohabitans maris TaxID=3071409 RepID=A0ABU0Z984_9ACTN|nr:ABC transporter permease [Phytohabitans sp. ZYX-F-186]MDQ7903598.1 ABC transporter permease [Phytohabitans sp. ZYX-F-186]
MTAPPAVNGHTVHNGLKPGAIPGRARVSRRGGRIRRRGLWLGALGVAVTLAAWELCAAYGLVDQMLASRPSQILVAGRDYFTTGTGRRDLLVSGTEFLAGFGLALVVGLGFGLAVGWWRWLDQLTEPLVSFAYASPRIALVPLLVVWFGIGLGSKVAVVFISAVFPIVLSTRTGVRTADRALLTLARAFDANRRQIFRTVILPGAVPSIVTGVRLAIGVGLVGMVVGELIASSEGLGYTILYAGNTFQTPLMFVALFVVSGAGVLMTAAVRAAERRLDRWRPDGHA